MAPRSWASSPDLHLDVDLVRTGGRRRALEQALRSAIQDRRLPAGTVLPSTRSLAQDLGLSRGTVLGAYEQLAAEGYVTATPGGTTKVAAGNGAAADPPSLAPGPSVRVDLRPGLLDLSRSFPREDWMRSLRAVMQRVQSDAFDYGDPRGQPALREALAGHLARSRGVVADPERIVVCSGFAHGLTLVARALRTLGRPTIAMEDPCLPVHRTIARDAGLSVRPVPVDDDGVSTRDLAGTDADAVLVTPAHQHPLGVTLAPSRRGELVAWARSREAVVLEDDYDGEFRYDRQPVGAVQGLAPEHVVYAGTVSKTLAPGIRLGWLVLPARLVPPVVDQLRFDRGGWTPPTLEQLALAELITSGRLATHVRRLRTAYRARRDLLLRAVQPLAGVRPSGVAAGLHLTLLVDGRTEDRIAAAARVHGVGLSLLGPYWHLPAADRPAGVVVGYARPPHAQFPSAVASLQAVLTGGQD